MNEVNKYEIFSVLICNEVSIPIELFFLTEVISPKGIIILFFLIKDDWYSTFFVVIVKVPLEKISLLKQQLNESKIFSPSSTTISELSNLRFNNLSNSSSFIFEYGSIAVVYFDIWSLLKNCILSSFSNSFNISLFDICSVSSTEIISLLIIF